LKTGRLEPYHAKRVVRINTFITPGILPRHWRERAKLNAFWHLRNALVLAQHHVSLMPFPIISSGRYRFFGMAPLISRGPISEEKILRPGLEVQGIVKR
jgi:hypothetical protein